MPAWSPPLLHDIAVSLGDSINLDFGKKGETMRYLNKESLDIICAMQALRAFAISDCHVTGNNKDWFTVCRKYYSDIPDEVMDKAGLQKNQLDFQLVLDFVVTDEMERTPFPQLGKFLLDPRS